MANLLDEFGLRGAGRDVSTNGNLLDEFGIDRPEPKAEGVVDTLKEGVKSTGRAVGAAVNTYTGNGRGIADKALEQQQAPKDPRLQKFMQDYSERTAALGDDPGVLETIGQGFGAVADNPAGAGLAVVEQLPNAAVALGGGWAGMKAGAAAGGALGSTAAGIGAVPGAAAGGIIGGIAGMFLGNAALETGHKAMGFADDGEVTPEEMSQAKSEGAIKGGVITGVDVLTLGIGGKVSSVMQRPTAAAMEAASRKVLIDNGVDVTSEAAVLAATKNPTIATAVRTAQDNARKATDKLGKRAAVAGTLLTMETVGEGLGEYLGELAATGEGNVPDAVLEGLLGLGQSGAEAAWNMARTAPGRMVQPQPSAENPAPAPVPAPDPQAGAISRTAAMLPGPSIAGALPSPESVLFADDQGNVSSQGPARDVDREYRPTGREQGPRDFGPGMDQAAPRGEQAPLEGQLIRGGIGAQPQPGAREPATYDNQPSLGLPAPSRAIPDMRGDNITVAPDGTAAPGKTPNTPPERYIQGGPGMDQQREVGKTYKGLPAANRAIRNAANPEQLEAVQVGPQTFEVRAKQKPAKRVVNRDRDSVMQAVIRLGGVKTEWRRDTTGDDKGNKFLPGVGALWSDKTGTGLDDMASLLDQNGYIPAGEMERDGGVSWLQQALRDEVSGMKTHAAPGSKLQEAQTLKAEEERLLAQAEAMADADPDLDTKIDMAFDLSDDPAELERRRLASEAFAAELDALFGDAPNEQGKPSAVESVGSDPQTAGSSADGDSGSAGEGKPGAVRGTDARAEGESEVTPTLELQSQTEQELAEADAATKARIKAEEKAQAEADEKRRKEEERAQIKAQSEAQADNFTLGVSGEDALSGQTGMFDSQPSLSELGGKPAATAPSADTAKTEPEIRKITAATHKSWRESVEQLGVVNGWHLMRDTLTGERFVLQTPYNSVGFDTEAEARAWAKANKANRNGYFEPVQAAGEQDAGPVKWFATRAKADTHLGMKRKRETHEIVEVSPTRFEIRPKQVEAENTGAHTPEEFESSDSPAVRSIRAGKALGDALAPHGFAKVDGSNAYTHTIEADGKKAVTAVRVIRDGDDIQYQVTSVTTAMDDGRMKANAPAAEEIVSSMSDAVQLARKWQEANGKWVKPKAAASSNTIFTDEAAEEARAFIRSMLNGSQLNSGVDPRLFQAGITLAGYHIEKGARTFAAFAKAMLADMGDGVRPYLKQWYMGVKYDPRASSLDGMSSAAMVDAFNLADIATEAASPAPAPTPATEQAQSLVDSFYALIRNDRMPKDNRELRKLVTEFDGKEADNARLKEAQEDLEAAIARYARDIAKRNMSDQATFSHLLGIYQQQPNLNVRTSSSIENQAYSTPAPLAYLAARLADIDRSSSVYEPTAGNGMLLMTADPKKATANELDEQRYNNLRALGFDAMQGDAMQVIESGALAAKSQDAIITNPPFGSVKDSAGNPVKISVDGYKIGQIDHLIAAEALKAMKDKGKATLILGANKVPGGVSTDDRIFFNWLYSHYNVTGHFELAGDLYNRQGAGWPVRVITINGRSSSANISPKQGVTQRVNTWEEVYEQYEQVLGAQLAKPDFTTRSGEPGTKANDPATAPQPDAIKTESPNSGSGTGARPVGTGNVSGSPAGNSGNSGNSKPRALGGSNTEQRPDAAAPKPDQLEQAGAATSKGDGAKPAQGAKPGKPAGSPVSTGENAFQAKYVPRASRKDEGVLIPVNMAQPMQDALSSLEDAAGDIDQFVMSELGYESQDVLNDSLMGLQVDSVAAAIYQMKQGKGIVIADQTGIGKGRQAAAIIRWAERSGKTPVFVTMKDTLFSDMYGDLLDIGSDNITPLLMNIDAFVKTEAGGKLFANQASKHRKVLETVAATGELPKGNNALFLTYSQINKPNTQRRALTALAPNAIFILDESHNAGGESATGEFMRELLIDAAGVTYLSATYAKRPDNMPLYFKTDIGAAISDSGNLMDAMAQGGLPLQTVVSNNLVKAGQMFRRERSYDGVSIETEVDTANRATHEAMSDAATSALRAIVKADKAFHEGYVKALKEELEAEGGALDDVAGNQASESVDHTEFSSVVHNFIRQMLLGIKADTAADRAIEALKRGEKPLIALENTMGSFLNEYAETNGIKTGDSLGEFDYRTVLSRALERSRAVKKKDAMGNEEIVQIPLGELDFITRAAYEDAQKIIDELKIDIPVSPLDWIRHRIEQAGYSVAEITGRNRTVDYSKARPVLSTLPSAEQTDKVGTTQRFNNGTLDAIILNVSGSTGISLHASEKFKDQRKRLMIVAQPAQDINVFMQMLGRVHRTGQVQVPAYLILNADLPAEKRPTALLNGKMQSLNANTSSNTESATSIKSQDMLNKYGDQVIGAYLQDNIELAIALGINPGSEGDAPDGLARKVTGRMALMPVADQQTFYAEIEEQYSSLIDYLNDSNQNELLPRTFDFEAEITKEATLVESTDEKTPFGQEAVYGEYKIKAQGKQMTPAEIRAEMDKNLGGVDGAAHAKALIAGLKQLWADNINQERRENGLGDTFDRAKYHAWLNKSVTDPAYAQTLVDKAQQSYDAGIPAEQFTPESMSTQPDQLRLITEHRIGSTWRIDINGDLYNAVVINVRSSHKKSGNPFSASKLQIQLAVNGPLRTITVPGSQWSKIEVAPLYGLSIDNAFRDQVEGSQTAKIVTGNLLAAYGEIKDAKGTIISFTKKDGSIEQGILLPKKFDFKTNTRGDFQFRTAKDVETFLSQSNDPMTARFGVSSRDASVRLKPLMGGVLIAVPKSKAKGGKYFLNKDLLRITGDFISEGNFMLTRVTGKNVSAAIEWLMRKAPLYALPSQVEEARRVLGLPPVGGKVESPRGSYTIGQAGQQFVSEPTATESGYETDLFGNPIPAPRGRAKAARSAGAGVRGDVQPASALSDTPTPAGRYHVKTIVGTEVSRRLGTDRINSFADLAQATQYLYRSAVERFDGIVTDKDGKPLAVVGGFKGDIDSASIPLGPTVAEAVRVQGAANIWLSHNHPSGLSELSRADLHLHKKFEDVFEGSGIQVRGLIAVGRGEFSATDGSTGSIPAEGATVRVPVVEREITGEPLTTQLESPAAAMGVATTYYNEAGRPGIILLDTRHRVAGWAPISPSMTTGPLRFTGGLNAIYRAVSEGNAAAAILVHGGELDNVLIGAHDAGMNIAAGLDKVNVRVLDVINATTKKSRAEAGSPLVGHTLYRLSEPGARGIPLFSAKAIAKKVMAATGLNATVVNTEADLPADLQAQIRRDKATGRVAGVYHNGTAYLVAANLRDTKHAISVMLHEAIGHGGVRSVLGERIGKVMAEIYRDMPAAMRKELERRYAGQMASMSEADARVMIAEEYVAHLAETDPRHSIINRLVARLRQFIRDTFGKSAALKWTRNDLVLLLAEARTAARNGGRGPGGAARMRQTAAADALAALPEVDAADESAFVASLKGDAATRSFASALYKARGTESPFFKAWFGKSRMVDKQGQPIAFVHRSYGERDTFTDADLGKNTGTPTAALGHFLARKDVSNVERYGPVVEQFYIRMEKPKVITQAQFEAMGDWSLTKVQAYRKTLMDQGHDGLYIQGLAWPVVFEGKSIKAKRNHGTFDATASTRYGLAQAGTAAFKRWFGKSKVVDAEGKPLVVYHGTSADFGAFLPGAYFTEHPAESAAYTGAGATMARGRMTGKYQAGRDGGTSDGAEVRYAYDGLDSLPSPEVGEVVATDDLAYRYEGRGKWTVFTDLEPDFSADATNDDHVVLRKGDAENQAAERIAEYEEAVLRATPGGDGGGNVMPVYLSIKNPIRLSALAGNRLAAKAGNDRGYIAEQIAKWEAQGYDGIVTESDEASVIPESREGLGGVPQQWVAFRPEQIKSAIGNNGDFDPNNPDIRYSLNDEADTTEALRKLGMGGRDADGIIEQIRNMTLGGLKAKLGEWSTRSEEGIFDGLAGIKRAEEAVGVTDANSQGYVSARMATGIADVMHGVLHYAAPEWRDGVISGKAGTRGVLEILGDLGQDNLTPWLAWLGGKRAQMLKAQGRENNLTDADITELLAMGRGKEELFEKVYRDYAKTNEAVLDLAEGAGLIDKDARAKWATEYYVPFYRQEEAEGIFTAPRTKRGLSHQTAAIKALKGGTLPTNDLLTNMLTGWTKRIDAAMKNKALLEVVDNLQGSEFLSDESPRFQQVLISRSQIAQQIRKDRKALAMAADMLGLPEGSKFLQVANQLMKPENEGFEKLWTKVAPTDPDIIRVQRGGKNEYYRVNDESLLRGLKFMEGSVFNDPITRIGRTFKRLLTTGVTASPDFILRNFIRDAAHAWMINKDGFILGKDSIKGMRDALREDQDYRDLMFAGGSFQGGYVHGADPEASAQIIRRALEKKGFTKSQQDSYLGSLVNTPAKAAAMLGKGWQSYRGLGDKVENANRLSTYKAALAAGKSKRQAAFEAKDLMDYSLRGNFAAAQWFTDVVPFLNARLQGLYKLGRAVKGDKTLLAKEVAMKGAYIALFSLLLAGINDDDERYQKLMDWDKDMHWHIFLGDQHFRIPKPFELGLIFGTVPERLLHALTGTQDGGDLAKAVSNGVFQTLAFNPVPQFYQPIRELQANRNFFRDMPIEDMSDEGKLPEARFDERTSAIGKALGQVTGPTLGISPKQLDHLVQGYTGTLGGYVLGMSNLVASAFDDAARPSARAGDLPVVKVLYQGNDVRSTKYQSEFYDMMREADQLHRTIKSYQEEGRIELAETMLKENADKIRARPVLGLARKQLGTLRNQMDAVHRDKAMSSTDKRERLDMLQRKANEVAERVVRMMGERF